MTVKNKKKSIIGNVIHKEKKRNEPNLKLNKSQIAKNAVTDHNLKVQKRVQDNELRTGVARKKTRKIGKDSKADETTKTPPSPITDSMPSMCDVPAKKKRITKVTQKSTTPETKNKIKGKKRKSTESDEKPTKVTKLDLDPEQQEESLKRSITEKLAKLSKGEEDKRIDTTAFVGNLPLNTNLKTFKALFARCGHIVTARLRGNVISTKIQNRDKSPYVSKRVSIIKKENLKALYGYIVFKNEGSLINACKMDGLDVSGHKIRVDFCGKKKSHDNNFTVFMGNLPHAVTENQIREHFAMCEENIDYIRLIRDSITGTGKGIGYIHFKDASGYLLALNKHESKLGERIIRVKPSTTGLHGKQKPIPAANIRIAKKTKTKTKGGNKKQDVQVKIVKKTGIVQPTNQRKSSFPVEYKKKIKKKYNRKTMIVNSVTKGNAERSNTVTVKPGHKKWTD